MSNFSGCLLVETVVPLHLPIVDRDLMWKNLLRKRVRKRYAP